jgi:DNA polymerase (family X)
LGIKIDIKNSDIAKILHKIGFLVEMYENDHPNATFKARSYKRASDVITSLSSNIDEIYRKDGLDGLLQIPSVGKAIASKIE